MPQVLYSTLYGSHLYGTNTPQSDHDVKRIVLPDLSDLLLCKRVENKVKKTNTEKNVKNTADDVDQEDIPLQVFVRDFALGQTYALEIAFSCEGDHAQQTFYDPFGDLFRDMVRKLKTEFLTSNIKAMMGYVVNQANLYSFKGERLNCAREFRELLMTMWTDKDAGDDQLHDSLPDEKLEAYRESLGDDWAKFAPNAVGYKEFYGEQLAEAVKAGREALQVKFAALQEKYPKYFRIDQYDIGGGRMRPCFVLLEKTFPWSITLNHALKVADTLINKYGSRADAASESNVDWKATMHAVRIVDEGLELLEYKKITLPRHNPARLLQIKRGELPLEPIKNELVEKLECLKELSATTDLPNSSDEQFKKRLEAFTLHWLTRFYGL